MDFYGARAGEKIVPASDEDAELLKKLKQGEIVKFSTKVPRNYRFFKKMHSFFRLCYDYYVEHLEGGLEYQGQPVLPNYDKFRHGLVILAGFHKAVYDIDGNMTLEPQSLAFESCEEEVAQKIFDACITAAIKQVYRYKMTEDELKMAVEQMVAYES